MPTSSEAIGSSSHVLAELRDLPATSVLLLFTPVMVPFGFLSYNKRVAKPSEVSKARLEKIDTDPFEHLGRALSKHHPRIRHVPYVLSVGLTDIHEAFMMQAGGIVVVTCEPETKGNRRVLTTRDSTLDALLAKQADFIESVKTALDDEDCRVPLVNLHIGDDERRPDGTDYESIWIADRYSADAVARTVQLLYASPM